MSNLFVLGFDEPHKAEKVSLKLQELQGEYLLHLAEVIVAIKDQKGKVKLRQAGSILTSDGVVFAGFCGALTSLIFLMPRRVLRPARLPMWESPINS